MNKVFLKHKGKVSEKEFLEYLDSICKNENIKAMILDFYNILKANDDKSGKKLTIQSFGKTPDNFPAIPLYTDQAKFLFLSEQDQAKNDALVQQFCDALNQNNEIADEKMRADAINQAFEIYQTQQDKLYDQNVEPIGASDLFRFQFINFVNKINIENSSHNQSSVRGGYIAIEKQITLYYVDDMAFEDKSKYFHLQNTINHELTHVLSMKTANFGSFPHFISPGAVTVSQGTICLYNPQLGELIKNNRMVFNANLEAEIILNEVATDYYSLYIAKRLTHFDFASHTYDNIPTRIYGAASDEFEDFTSYGELGHIFEIIFKNQSSFGKCINNPVIPVWGQYNIIKNFFGNTKISNKVCGQVDNTLSKIFNIETKMFKEVKQFDKFKLLKCSDNSLIKPFSDVLLSYSDIFISEFIEILSKMSFIISSSSKLPSQSCFKTISSFKISGINLDLIFRISFTFKLR